MISTNILRYLPAFNPKPLSAPAMDMKYVTPFLIIAAAFVLQMVTPAAGAQEILVAQAYRIG